MDQLIFTSTIENESCYNCKHLCDDGEHDDFGNRVYYDYKCNKYPNKSNLKNFPFRTTQKCFEQFVKISGYDIFDDYNGDRY